MSSYTDDVVMTSYLFLSSFVNKVSLKSNIISEVKQLLPVIMDKLTNEMIYF